MYESLLPSFLITFREALEASLIMAIIIAYLKKSRRQSLIRYSLYGAGVAVGLSCLFGSVLLVVYGNLTGFGAQVFEGVAALFAAFALTYMILWMTKHAQTIRTELEQKVESTVTRGQLFGIVALAFVAVFREGLETVLFLTTLLTIDSAGTLVGLSFAVFVVLATAWVLMRGVHRLDVKRFFQVTSIILIIFAAGLVGYGVHELIEAGETLNIQLGVLSQPAFDINPPLGVNGTYPLLHEKGVIGSLLGALVGYDGNPEWLRVIVYLAYWFVMGAYVLKNYWRTREILA
ncbi:MAG: FTR1 family iron permease [Candidatus Bathyarchaeia archaeon]|nr:ferrous iron transporter [Candidatus Bathyarchaeota archaeon A05DMB-4]MDH7594721.1 FTR1 family protein [Candidatus Bathyarchaeota archaeon]